MQLTARQREFVRIAGMSPAIYATDRRSAALRYTDGSAPRTDAVTAQEGPTPDSNLCWIKIGGQR